MQQRDSQPRKPTPPKVCANCGVVYECKRPKDAFYRANHRKSLYCNFACASAGRGRARRGVARKTDTKICPTCGEEFGRVRANGKRRDFSGVKHCSHKCAMASISINSRTSPPDKLPTRDMVGGIDYMVDWPDNVETLYKAEPPLEKLAEPYHGFWGTPLINKITGDLQCHICGAWFKNLSVHVNKRHGISARDYKIAFRLPLSQALITRESSRRRSEGTREQQKRRGYRVADNPKAKIWQRKRVKRTKQALSGRLLTKEDWFNNKNGACDQQLLRRYAIVSELAGKEIPSKRDFMIYDPKFVPTVWGRYGGLLKFRKKFNLTNLRVWSGSPTTDDNVIAGIRARAVELGRMPVAEDFAKGVSPNRSTIYRHFGSYRRALVIAFGDETAIRGRGL